MAFTGIYDGEWLNGTILFSLHVKFMLENIVICHWIIICKISWNSIFFLRCLLLPQTAHPKFPFFTRELFGVGAIVRSSVGVLFYFILFDHEIKKKNFYSVAKTEQKKNRNSMSDVMDAMVFRFADIPNKRVHVFFFKNYFYFYFVRQTTGKQINNT